MSLFCFDVVQNNRRTDVYTVPSEIFCSMGQPGSGMWAMEIERVRQLIADRHASAEVHLGIVISFEYSPRETPSYHLGDPARHDVLCGYVELDAGEGSGPSGGCEPCVGSELGSLFPGRRVMVPVPVFPDHPQYEELKAAQKQAREDRAAGRSHQHQVQGERTA